METTHYPTTFVIDRVPVEGEVKHLAIGEYIAFERDWQRLQRITNRQRLEERLARQRLNKVDPQTEPAVEWATPPNPKTPEGEEYLEQVLARDAWRRQRTADAIAFRDLEETEAERVQRERIEAQDDAFAKRFITQAVTDYVRIGEATGAELLVKYAARTDVLSVFIATIWTENTIGEELKKKLRSASGLTPSSNPSTPPANGDRPETIAAAALSAAPASVEGATA